MSRGGLWDEGDEGDEGVDACASVVIRIIREKELIRGREVVEMKMSMHIE